jgi:hypothetical protein
MSVQTENGPSASFRAPAWFDSCACSCSFGVHGHVLLTRFTMAACLALNALGE